MRFDILGDVNWLAVVVAGIAWFVLGAVWYMPAVFGKAWMASIGWDTSEDPPAMKPADYLKPLVAFVIACAAIGMIAVSTESDTLSEGIVLGLVGGIGVSGMLFYVTAVFEPKKPAPMTWAAVTAGYHAVGLMIAGVVLSVWR